MNKSSNLKLDEYYEKVITNSNRCKSAEQEFSHFNKKSHISAYSSLNQTEELKKMLSSFEKRPQNCNYAPCNNYTLNYEQTKQSGYNKENNSTLNQTMIIP